MEREDKIHWIENKLFEYGGEVSDLQIPTTYGDGKCDFIKRVSMYNGEGVMIHLQMKNASVPITELGNDGINGLFRTLCR